MENTVHSYCISWNIGEEEQQCEMFCSEQDDERIIQKFKDDAHLAEVIKDLTVRCQGEGPGNLDMRNALRHWFF